MERLNNSTITSNCTVMVYGTAKPIFIAITQPIASLYGRLCSKINILLQMKYCYLKG